MKKMIKKLAFVLSVILLPNAVYASGGGPLLVMFNLSGFVLGFIGVVLIEYFMLSQYFRIKYKGAIADIIRVNLISTLSVTLLFSLGISGLTLLMHVALGDNGAMAAALGTWVFDRSSYVQLPIIMFLVWYLIIYIMTSFFEASLYKKRWNLKEISIDKSNIHISFLINALSHMGVLVIIIIVWMEIFRNLWPS